MTLRSHFLFPMGNELSAVCNCEPRRPMSILKPRPEQAAPEAHPAAWQNTQNTGRNQTDEPEASWSSEPPQPRPESELSADGMLVRIEALQKLQDDLRAKKPAGWKEKWQEADNLRQNLRQRVSNAASSESNQPTRRPAKFERSFSTVRCKREGSLVACEAKIAAAIVCCV